MLYRAFIDDSSDGTQKKYTIAAALIGSHRAWSDFNREWKRALQEPPRIQWFHSKEWRSLTGEFAQFRDHVKWPKPIGGTAADAKRARLKSVIEESRLAALCIGVLIDDFNLVRTTDSRAAEFFRSDPYEGALASAFYECTKALRRVDPQHCIGFVSDSSHKAPIYSAIYADFKQKNARTAETMRGLVHLDDKKWPGLQAADLVAHITNQIFKQVTQDQSGGQQLLKKLPELQSKFYKIANWDKWYMCHILNDLIRVDLFDRLGIDRRRYKSEYDLDNEKQQGKSTNTIVKDH